MAKKVLQIKNFSGGLNTFSDARDIKDNQFRVLDNVSTDENSRIRLSGGFDKHEMIQSSGFEEDYGFSFARPSVSIADIHSDYKTMEIPNGDFSQSAPETSPEGWTIANGDGAGWTVQTSGGKFSQVYGSHYVENIKSSTSTYEVVDLGSITSSKFKLEPGAQYKIHFSMHSTHPFFYQPGAEIPRITLKNEALGLYHGSNGYETTDTFATESDQIVPPGTSNFSNTTGMTTDTGVGGYIRWASNDDGADWEAYSGYASIARVEDTDSSLKGYMGNGTNHCMKVNTTSSYSSINNSVVVSDNIAITASNFPTRKVKWDFLYKTTADGNGTPRVRIYDSTNGVFLNSWYQCPNSHDTWTNARMGTTGWEYGADGQNTLEGLSVTISENTAVLRIYIAKSLTGVGEFHMTGFRIFSDDSISCGGTTLYENAKAYGFPMGYTTSYLENVSFPNTWSQTENAPYVLSSWPQSKIDILSHPRTFSYSFTVGSSVEQSDEWQIRFNAGKWGSSGALNNLGVQVSFCSINRVSLDASDSESHFILSPNYDSDANMTRIRGFSWNSDEKKYENFSDIYNDMMPSFNKKASIAFANAFGRTFICNSSYNTEDYVYQFFYDNLTGANSFRIYQTEPYVPNFETLETVADAAMFADEWYDAKSTYINRAADSDENDSIISFDIAGVGSTESDRVNLINTRSGVKHQFTQPVDSDGLDFAEADENRWFAHPRPAVDDDSYTNPNTDAVTQWGAAPYHGGESSPDDSIHKLIEITASELASSSYVENNIAQIQLQLRHDWKLGGISALYWDRAEGNAFQPVDSNLGSPAHVGDSMGRNMDTGCYVDIFKIDNELGDQLDESQSYISQHIVGGFFNFINEEAHSYGTVDYSQAEEGSEGDEIEGWNGSGEGSNTGTFDVTFDFGVDEIDKDDSIAVRITPFQYMNSGWWKFGSLYHDNYGPQADATQDYLLRGIAGHDKWTLNTLKFKTYATNYSSGSNVLTLDDDSVGITMEFGTPSSGLATGWNSTFSFKITTVNFFDEESHLGPHTQSISNNNSTHCPRLSFQINPANNYYDKMVRKFKIYCKKSTWSSYILQATVDLIDNKIYSSNTGNSADGGVFQSTVGQEIFAFTLPREELLEPNVTRSYVSETEIEESEATSASDITARFKTAVIVENRMFIGNVYQDGEIHSDRMMYSVTDKYSIFPKSNILDVAVNDGDEIVSLQYYQDKLLQFKRKKVFIINVSEPGDEFLEDTIEGAGITSESQITKTMHGIVWINERGIFLFNGHNVDNLIDDKLAISNWKNTISGWDLDGFYYPSIGYDVKSDKMIIMPTGYSSQDIYNINADSNDVENYYENTWRANLSYIYDFSRQSFYMNYAGQRGVETDAPHWVLDENNSVDSKLRMPHIDGKKSNFFNDIKGNLMIASDSSSNPGFFTYNDIPSSTPGLQSFFNDRNMRIITKDYDFGDPSIRKKIYKVYITFKTTFEETALLENAKLTNDFYSPSYVKAYYAIDGTDTWTEFSSSKSTNYDSSKGFVDADSETSTTLTNAIGASDTSLVVGSTSNMKAGYLIKIGTDTLSDREIMLVESVDSGTAITVKRGYGYGTDIANTYTDLQGVAHDASEEVTISNGDWIQGVLRPLSSINNIKSLKLMLVNSSGGAVPKGFQVNDISIIYRTKNVR